VDEELGVIMVQIEVLHQRNAAVIAQLEVPEGATIRDVKVAFSKIKPKYYPDRQNIKGEQGGRMLKDEMRVGDLPSPAVYFKDLGPQIGWSTVFLAEYAGPLLVYLLFYMRPSLIYSGASKPTLPVVHIAAACWSFHYLKRILETMFVHRFSHATMPIANLFKNCSYYWGAAAFVSYFVNHPLYQAPCYGEKQVYAGLGLFLFCELGNFSVHVALRNLRPAGSTVRRIPVADSNPLTLLFNFVSCPNYSYEVGSWFWFSVMTQSLPALLFTLVGFYQMSVWAQGKHRNYKREFEKYPKGRKAILPFLI
jgi:very-long-chain enoyl-CoA reductase